MKPATFTMITGNASTTFTVCILRASTAMLTIFKAPSSFDGDESEVAEPLSPPKNPSNSKYNC